MADHPFKNSAEIEIRYRRCGYRKGCGTRTRSTVLHAEKLSCVAAPSAVMTRRVSVDPEKACSDSKGVIRIDLYR